jgi:hypothetical protein
LFSFFPLYFRFTFSNFFRKNVKFANCQILRVASFSANFSQEALHLQQVYHTLPFVLLLCTFLAFLFCITLYCTLQCSKFWGFLCICSILLPVVCSLLFHFNAVLLLTYPSLRPLHICMRMHLHLRLHTRLRHCVFICVVLCPLYPLLSPLLPPPPSCSSSLSLTLLIDMEEMAMNVLLRYVLLLTIAFVCVSARMFFCFYF